jgi:hypothetical protein
MEWTKLYTLLTTTSFYPFICLQMILGDPAWRIFLGRKDKWRRHAALKAVVRVHILTGPIFVSETGDLIQGGNLGFTASSQQGRWLIVQIECGRVVGTSGSVQRQCTTPISWNLL